MKRRIFSILIVLSMLSAMLPVVAMAQTPTDFSGWMEALDSGEYINIAAGKPISAPGDSGNGSYGITTTSSNPIKSRRMVDNNRDTANSNIADWVNLKGNNFITIDLCRKTSVDGVAISRRVYGEGYGQILLWGSEEKLTSLPTENNATLLMTLDTDITNGATAISGTNKEFRYIYATGGTDKNQNVKIKGTNNDVAQGQVGIWEIYVMAEKDNNAKIKEVSAGLPTTNNYGTESYDLTDGDSSEYYASYGSHMTPVGGGNPSTYAGDWMRIDLGYEYDLKYFYCCKGQAGCYQQANLSIKASNTTNYNDAVYLIQRTNRPLNGCLWDISGKYRYIWVCAEGGDAFVDNVKIYGIDDREMVLGDWTVVESAGEITASLPVEYIDTESQMFIAFMINYDSDGKMVGNPVQADITRQDEVDGDGKETQTFVISSTDSVSIDHSQIILIDENFKLISIHNESYDGTWNGFNKDKGTATTFDESVSMSVSAEYPFDNQSATISGKAVAEDDLIMVEVLPQSSFFSIEQSEVEGFAYLGFAKAENGYEFNIPINEAGVYTINVSRTAADGTGESKEFVYEVKDAEDIKTAINSFFPADETDVPDYEQALADAIAEGVVGEVDIIDTRVFADDKFAEIAADVANILAVYDEDTGDIEMNTSDLVDVLNTMVVVYKLSEGEVSVMDEYGEYITENAGIRDYVAQNLPYSLTADVNCQGDMAELTNLGESGVVKFTFTETMDTDSLTSDTVVVTKGDDEQNYEVAKNDGDNFWIDLSSLDANSQYKIVFSNQCQTANEKYMLNSVEFEFTTGKIIDVPYKEGKIIKNVLLNKPIINADDVQLASQSFAAAGVSVLNDGVKPNSGANQTTSIGVSQNVIFDLGGLYEPVAVAQYYYLGTSSYTSATGYYWYHAAKNSFYGCANPTMDENNVPTEASFKTKGVKFAYTGDNYGSSDPVTSSFMVHGMIRPIKGEYLTALESYGPIRYVSFSTSAESSYHSYNSEIEVYAYVDIEATEIEVNNETIDTTYGSSHTFTTEIIDNNASDMTPHMIAVAYDEDGYVTASEVKPLSNGTNSATINAPAGSVGAYAVIVEDLSTMVPIVNPMTIGEKLAGGTAKKTGAYIDADIDCIEVGAGVASNDVADYTVLTLIIQALDSDYATPDEFFETLTRGMLMSSRVKVAYVGDAKAGYTFEDLEEGSKYYIQTVASTVGGSKKTVARHKQAILSVSEKNAIVNDVMSSNGEALVDAITDAVFDKEAVAKNLIYDVENLAYTMDDERFVEILGYTKAAMAAEEDFEESLPAIADIINAAQTVYAIDNADIEEAAELLEEYGVLLGDIYTDEANLETMLELYANHSDYTNAQGMKNAINWSSHLSLLEGTNDTECAEVLEAYDYAFGIDADEAKNKKVSLIRVSKYFDRSNLEELYGKTAFAEAYEAALKKAVAAASESSGSKTQTGTFGGLGGGVETGRGESSKPAETTKPVATAEPKKSGFADMSGYAWADEAVAKLVEANVISGNQDGAFEPSRNVTRGEFVKMLVVASKIKVDEGSLARFVDVPDSSWQHPYVQIAYSRGICRGVDDFTFNVNGAITRQDMAVMIANLLKYLAVNTSGDGVDFADENQIANYAASAVEAVANAGLINGFEDGSFRPNENTRRVDAAMVISKLMEKIN